LTHSIIDKFERLKMLLCHLTFLKGVV